MKVLKNIIAFSVLLAVVFTACKGTTSSDITGTYVNHATGEFSVADDTLIVEHVEKLNYLLHRKTGYQLIDESGKAGKRVFETEEWKAVYDEGSQSMTENRKARVISFDPVKGLLKLENSTYQRIN